MVGHLENISPTFAQMSDIITNDAFTTVCANIANTTLSASPHFYDQVVHNEVGRNIV